MASSNNRALPSVVHTIERRVEQLIADHKRVSDLNHTLIEECEGLKLEKREAQERIVQLERELAMAELQSGLAGTTKNNARARAYINRLMREVDTCITLISSPGAELKGQAGEEQVGQEGEG